MASTEVNGLPDELPTLPRRASTAESAAEVLRSQISQGRLLPGTKLREEQLATAFSISRNTVREAFRLLSHERLVDHALHRGVFVRVVSAEDIQAMYTTRRLIEPLGIEAVAADPDRIRALRTVVDAAAAAAAADDWDTVGTADIDFHRQVVAACRSTHLSGMFEHLLAELRLAFLRMPERSALHAPFVARNQRLVDLLEAHDRQGALAEIVDYLNAAERQLLDALETAANR